MKRQNLPRNVRPQRSPPARGRGLKHETPEELKKFWEVAPRAGAWIETRRGPDIR